MIVSLLAALALAAEPIPDACPRGPAWGTIVGIRYDPYGVRHAAPADSPEEQAGSQVVEVTREEYGADVTRIGRVGGQLCGGDRLETWHGVSLDVQLVGQGGLTRLPEGAHLLLEVVDGAVHPWLLEGIQEWYAPVQLAWTLFQTSGLQAVASRSSFRVEVDKATVDGTSCACAPTVRIAVLEKDPDGSGDHELVVEHQRGEVRIPGGTAMEFRPGERPRQLSPEGSQRMLGALGASASSMKDVLERAQGLLRPVGYPLVQLQLERTTDHAPYRLEVGQMEVTNGTWAEVMGSPHEPAPGCTPASLEPGMPVGCVTWEDAVALANHLSRRNGYQPAYRPIAGLGWAYVPSADGYRLPTWPEWRQLLLADPAHDSVGTGSCTANLAGQESVQPQGVLDALACSDPWAGPAAVSEVYANGGRLRGLVGNVWELLSCHQDQLCYAAGGSWRTGREELAGVTLSPLRLGRDEARPDVGLRLVRQGP